jgi:Hint domain
VIVKKYYYNILVIYMTSIYNSGTLTYYSGNFYYDSTIVAFPIMIYAGVTVTFGSNLVVTSLGEYLIISSDNVTIDGANYQIDYSGLTTNYAGFVNNGSGSSNGYNNCVVKNIGCINSSSYSVNTYVTQDNFGVNATNCSIYNCNVICKGGISSGGIAGIYNYGDISNCYVICGGDINDAGGISGVGNSGKISNCYVICGGNITGSSNAGGIVCANNSAAISECYTVIGGSINYGGGVVGQNNQSEVSNCYCIIGGSINNFNGGILSIYNTSSVSNCYVIVCGYINNNCGGIAGYANSGSISNCYVNYYSINSGSAISPSGTITGCNSLQSTTPNWTSIGANYLNNSSSAWANTDTTNNQTPWLLTAFNTAIASSKTTTSTSGTISLNTYGQSFANGSVYSGQKSATFTYNVGYNIDYSGVSSGTTYTLGLYAYQLLSNLSFTFSFTNESAIKSAFNYSGSSANDIVPYAYSVTNDVSLTYAAISNVCFQEKTLIKTDQGIVQIDKLDPEINTINNKKILAVTRTISLDKYLVCFEKDSLGKNYPKKSTVVTKQHKILYRGKLIEAENFIGHFVGVKKVKYTGEVLYNILMEKHELISVNNLVCETLHPQNIVAKLYSKFIGDKYRDSIIEMMNECILKNNYTAYKKIVNRL